MKVLENKQFPMEITCENCSSKIEIEKDDLHIGYLGMYYVICPVCGKKTYVDELEGAPVTKDTIKFPDHFFYFGDGKDVSTEEIEKEIRQGIEWLRMNPDNFIWSMSYGNMDIHVENYSGDKEYRVVVTKNYYECTVPYEQDDYDAQESIGWGWENKGVRIVQGEEKKVKKKKDEYWKLSLE